MQDDEMGEVTQLLLCIKKGDDTAKSKLVELVYDELRWLAVNRLGDQRNSHSLGVTGLVHEALLRFLRGTFPTEGREHFFRAVNQAMRQVLIDHYRSKQARHGRLQRIPLDDLVDALGAPDAARYADLKECLEKLRTTDDRPYQVVFGFYFLNEHLKDLADQFQLSVSGIEKILRFAKASLLECLGDRPQ